MQPITRAIGTFLEKAGVFVGVRQAVNYVDSATVTWTVTDDAGNNRVSISADAIETGEAGAPSDGDYLVGTSNGALSAEIVVGTSPGGELGGTWGSPSVDASHSGSTHAATQAAAELTAATALETHEDDTTSIHGIPDTALLETTTGSQDKVDLHTTGHFGIDTAGNVA